MMHTFKIQDIVTVEGPSGTTQAAEVTDLIGVDGLALDFCHDFLLASLRRL